MTALVAVGLLAAFSACSDPPHPGTRMQASTARAGFRPSPSASPSPADGAAPVDASTFAPGACVAFPPTAGNRHLTIFLDAGHGSPDPGASGRTQAGKAIDERALTLKTVLDALPLLRADGYRVVLSRTTDSTVARPGPGDLRNGAFTVQGAFREDATRAVCANRAGAAVLVSLHFNSGPSTRNAGMLTAYDDVRTFAAENLRLATLLQNNIVASMNSHGWGIPNIGVVKDNIVGAPALSAKAHAYGRLLLLGPPDPRYLTTPSTMPGAVIEPLFLTNPFEGSIADSVQGQQSIAAGLVQAIDQFTAPPGQGTPTGTAH